MRRPALAPSRGTTALKIAAALLGVAICALPPASAGEGHRIDLVDRFSLRVCADPANMPFSNDKGEGFENKIAEIVAAELKVPVDYVWFPQATGFIRQTLFSKRCDVVMGYAQGDELVLNTNAYYRSVYTLVYQKGGSLDGVDRLADPRLRGKRLGIIAGTPPATAMTALGLMKHAKPYPLMVDRRYDAPGERMVADIRSGEIDAGILWGPMAGYFVANDGDGEKLTVVPLLKETVGARMAYRITFGVRQTEDDWKRELNALIVRLQGKFDAVLLKYGVPLLDEQSNIITTPRQ
jgi:quinoprotein dehydrogenase-associated probable ABC transporter substrate-binding protein